MSKRTRKHRKHARPTSDRQRKQSAVEALTQRLREPNPLDDPYAGIPPQLFAVAIAVDRRVKAKPWHYLPKNDAEIGVRDTRGHGWTSAHAGTIGEPVVSDEERLTATLTAEEREAFRLQGERKTQQEIANALNTTRARVRGLLAMAWRKLAEVAETVRRLNASEA